MYLPTKDTFLKGSAKDFLYKSIYCGYSFELHRHVDAIQMGTHNICLLVDKKYSGSNLKTTESLYAHRGMCGN